MARLTADQAPDRNGIEALVTKATGDATAGVTDLLNGLSPIDIMRREALAFSDFMADLRPRWEANYAALRNEHFAESKYNHPAFQSRSKLHRPKTLGAVRKNMATMAAAMFSTDDLVSVKAESEDPYAMAAATVNNELMNYRLDRTSVRGGLPWFPISMGAFHDSQTTAICCSKQFWEYQVVDYEDVETVGEFDEITGEPILDEAGQPITADNIIPRTRVMRDRPMSIVVPPENLIFDLAAPWYDIAQGAAFFAVTWPMTAGAFKQMMANNADKADVEWLPVDDKVLRFATEEADTNRKGVRQARERGYDRSDAGRDAVSVEHRVIYPQENFVRIGGIDFHFWSIGSTTYASTVRPTADVYPEFAGERPYVVGTAVVMPHVPIPMSPVESWQPLQREINDVVNLQLDAQKQSVQPFAKIKQGSLFDASQLKNIGSPGASIVLRNMEDMEFDRHPGPDGSSYVQMTHLNADFDSLAGSFDGGSVQTNRSLNETVGGMRLLSGAANALTEFDMRVVIETWTEPVLRQILRLEQYYESDEVVLAVAGERAAAKLAELGVDYLDEEDLGREMALRVNIGIGAADPMQALQKLQMGMGAIAQAMPMFDRPATLNGEEFVREVMGKVGYKDGSRFVTFGDPANVPPPPEVQKAQMEAELKQAEIGSREKIASENNATKLQIEQMKERFDLIETLLREMIGQSQQAQQLAHAERVEGKRQAAGLIKDVRADRSRAADRESRMMQQMGRGAPPRG